MKWLVLILLLVGAPVQAVQPGEMLDDPVLEARAREISSGLRCPVCRNESIDESNATLAGDLRVLVRERLLEGDSDAEVVAYIVDRFGEFVLLRPDASGVNLILWLAAPGMFLGGLAIAWTVIRRKPRGADAGTLSAEEQARLDEILRK